MEEFVPSKKVSTDFNGGEKYKNGDSIQAETINNLVEGLLYENEDVGGGTTVLVGGEAVAEFDADRKVGFTDRASQTNYGVVKTYNSYGVQMYNGEFLATVPANDNDIKTRDSTYKPITPRIMDKALKVCITTNTETLSDGEKTDACDWLGARKSYLVENPTNKFKRAYVINGTTDGTVMIADRISTFNTASLAAYFAPTDTIADNGITVSLLTGTPKLPYHSANKEYVDEQVKEIHCICIYSDEVRIFFYLPAEKGVSFSSVDDIYNYLLEKGIIYNGLEDVVGLPASGIILVGDKWYQIAFIVADRGVYVGITAVGAEASYNLLYSESVTDIIM